jgi:hypothetical protein
MVGPHVGFRSGSMRLGGASFDVSSDARQTVWPIREFSLGHG